MADKKPLCPQCRDTAGWLEDQNGNITGRCPCRYREITPDEARENGVAATVHANPQAMKAALAIIRETALTTESFSANDVRARMKIAQVPGEVVGAAFRQAAKDRVIRADSYLPSSDPGTHAHPVRSWRSLIYRMGRSA